MADEPVEGWFHTVLDADASMGHAVLLVDSQDLPAIAYVGLAAGEQALVRLARCLDPGCETVGQSEVQVPPDSMLSAAALRPDGSLVVAVATGGPNITEGTAVLVLCDDPECARPTEQQLPGVAISALAVSESDRLVAVVSEWPDSESCEEALSLMVCEDRGCGDRRLVEIGREDAGHGTTWIAFLDDGTPVVAYEAFSGNSMDAEGVRLATCSDPECTTVVDAEFIDDTTEPVALDLPMFAYRRGSTGAVAMARCVDGVCGQALDVEMYRSFEGGMLQPVSVPNMLDDGSAAVFVYRLPSLAASDRGDDAALVMFRCIGLVCDDVFVSDSVPMNGDAPIGAFLTDGFAVMSRSSGAVECAIDDEECQEQAERGSLELTLCRGDGCGAEFAASPVQRSAIDVSAQPIEGDVVFAKDGDIWLLTPGSPEPINLTATWEHWEGGPAWAPDGTQIAFHSDRDDPTGQNANIYTMNADGTDVTRITDHAEAEHFPAWSPDGTRLVFSRDNTTNDLRHLVILDLDSGKSSSSPTNSTTETSQPGRPTARRSPLVGGHPATATSVSPATRASTSSTLTEATRASSPSLTACTGSLTGHPTVPALCSMGHETIPSIASTGISTQSTSTTAKRPD